MNCEVKEVNVESCEVSSLLTCSLASARVEVIGDCTLYFGDCFEIMPRLEKFDLILTDPPYGVTQNKWDVSLDPVEFWQMIKPKMVGPCILTATEPFAADIINANRKMFKYDLIWEKGNATGFLNANRMPLRAHENILVFYEKLPVYTPKKFFLATNSFKQERNPDKSTNYGKQTAVASTGSKDGSRFPRSVFSVKMDAERTNSRLTKKGRHPTQKPVALMQYLLSTYLPTGLVCDPFMGSGTTGVACVQQGLQFVGIEREEKYFDVACKRIEKAIKDKPPLFARLPEFKKEVQPKLF